MLEPCTQFVYVEYVLLIFTAEQICVIKIMYGFTCFYIQVQDVTMEIQDLLQWLENTDLRLSSSKTMWGMPDSATERLNVHLVRLI